MHAIAYLSGNLYRKGGLLFHPLATGTAQLLDVFGWEESINESRIGDFTSVLETLPGGILSDEITSDGPESIRAMVVGAGGPITSIPGETELADAFNQLDYLISVDMFENKTARFADLILPAPTWLERWDVAGTTAFFQKDYRLQMAGPVTEPPEDVRSEHRIYAELGNAIGEPLLGNQWLTSFFARTPFNKILGTTADFLGNLPNMPDHGAMPVPSPSPGDYLHQKPLNPDNRLCFWDSTLNEEVKRVRRTVRRITESEENEKTKKRESDKDFTLICRRRRLGHNSWLHGAGRGDSDETEAWFAKEDFERFVLESGDHVRIISEDNELILP
jgi:anaerobic selenocysteine-containing dehydrogenase